MGAIDTIKSKDDISMVASHLKLGSQQNIPAT